MGSRPAEPPRLTKSSPSAAVVQARIDTQVRALHRLDPLVREDSPDSVHQMRVAARRLRSALATFRPLLDREVAEPLRDDLGWLGRMLGEARDTEVMRERLRSLIELEEADEVSEAARRRIDRELDRQYAEARSKALAAMDSPRYAALLARLDRLAAAPPWTAAAAAPAREVLPRLVGRDWRRLRRRVHLAADATERATRDVGFHDARKAAKRLRYAAETAEPVYGEDARLLGTGAKDLQTLLGEHQDSVVTRQWLRDLAEKAAAEGEDGFGFGVLHAQEEQSARVAEERLAEVWRTASEKQRRHWLS